MRGFSWGISQRLWLGFGALLVLLITVATVSVLQSRDLAQVVQRLSVEVIERVQLSQTLVSEVESFQTAQKSGLLARATLRILQSREYFDRAEQAAARIEKQVTAMDAGLSERERGLIDSFREPWQGYLEVHQRVREKASQGQIEPALALLENEGAPRLDAAREALARLTVFLREDLAAQRQAVAERMQRDQLILIGMVALSLLIGGLLAVTTTRYLRGSLDRVLSVAARVVDGDLTARTGLSRNDEISAMGRAVDGTCRQFEEVVAQVAEVAESMKERSSSLSLAGERVVDGMHRQEAATERANELMERNLAEVDEVVGHSDRAARYAEEVDRLSTGGLNRVGATVSALQALTDRLEQAGAIIHQLDAHGGEIGSVVDMIRAVSEQTNLLALNAAIEAARAGGHGRGFAVVADEVRTLSMRTRDSTDRIADMIGSLKTTMHQAAELMTNSSEYAERTLQEAEQAGGQLKEIDQAVSKIRDMNGRIAAAAQSQRGEAHELSSALQEIAVLAGEAIEVSRDNERMGSAMREQSDDLGVLVGRFRFS
ncbi:methyl-accepting chemotaxis protein [Guyparkeria halopsychrophila]|uniref:methyl-accepting chemotaxis protein n=1 Tax=Guyparkeria halopsychrophila TaxID=3139421 RepID=UPI0037C5B480